MKNLLIAAAMLVATAAQAVDAYLPLDRLSCNPASNRIVEIQRQQPFPGNLTSNWSGSGGFVVVTNVEVGDYNVWVRKRGNAGEVAFSFSITTNDAGTVFIHTNNLSVIGAGTYPRVGKAAWTIQASDSRYAPIGSAGMAVAAGTNVVATTNGSVVTINAAASGSGAAVTGSGLATTTTNAGVVTVAVSTNAVQAAAVAAGMVTNNFSAAMTFGSIISFPLGAIFPDGSFSFGSGNVSANPLGELQATTFYGPLVGNASSATTAAAVAAGVTNQWNLDLSNKVPNVVISTLANSNLPSLNVLTQNVTTLVVGEGGISGNGQNLSNLTASAINGGAVTAVNNMAATNAAAVTTNEYGIYNGFGQYSARHQNIGKTPRLHALLYSNAPIRFLFIGDDAFHPEMSLLSAFTNAGYSFNGSALSGTPFGIGNYFYQSAAGSYVAKPIQGVAQQDSNSDRLTSFGLLRLANGASVTNISALVNGWDTTTIAGLYYVTNTGGTVGVYTNRYGQTPTLCTTIDTAVGTGGWRKTNIALPALVTDCVVSYRSVGDNIVQGFGQWNTNLGAGIRVDVRTGGNIGFADFTANAALSNYSRVLLSDYDVLVVSDLGAPLDGTNLFNLIQANNLDIDVITSSFVQRDNGSQESRRQSLELGRQTPFVVVDTGALLTPTNTTMLTKFYDGNESHLNLFGHKYFGSYMANTLQWGREYWAAFGTTRQTNYYYIPAQDLRNESGAVSLTHIYNVFGTPYRMWGLRIPAGTYGGSSSYPYPRAVLGDSKRIYARFNVLTTNVISGNTGFRMFTFPRDVNITNITDTWSLSSASEQAFTIGNSGQTNFTSTPWHAITPGSRGPWDGWISIGFGAASKAYDCFVVGVELRTDPQDRIGQ